LRCSNRFIDHPAFLTEEDIEEEVNERLASGCSTLENCFKLLLNKVNELQYNIEQLESKMDKAHVTY